MNETAMRSLEEQRQQAMSMAGAMIDGASRMLEIQSAAARSFLENQGRTAAMFGAPDLSPLLKSNDQLQDFFNAGARQTLAFMRQTNDAVSQVQAQLAQLAQAQTQWVTEQMRQSMDEFNRQTAEGLKRWRESSQQMIDEAQRTAQSAEARSEAPSIVVSGLEGTRAESRQEERSKATAKR